MVLMLADLRGTVCCWQSSPLTRRRNSGSNPRLPLMCPSPTDDSAERFFAAPLPVDVTAKHTHAFLPPSLFVATCCLNLRDGNGVGVVETAIVVLRNRDGVRLTRISRTESASARQSVPRSVGSP